MSKLSQQKLRWIATTIVIAMLLYISIILYALNKEDIGDTLSQIPIQLYISLLFLSLLSYFLRLGRWYFFLKPLESSIGFMKHLLIYFSGFAMTTTPGKAGETIRSLFLSPIGIKYHQSLAAFFSERLLDVVAVVTLSLLLFASSFPEYQLWIILSALFALSITLFLRSELITLLIKRFLKHKSKVLLIAFQQQVSNFLSNQSLLVALPLSLAAWTAQGYGLYLIVDALGLESNPLLIIGIYNISILAGAMSFIPGGIGATEVAITLLLVHLGMDTSLALIASMICRGMTLWVAIGIGVLSMGILSSKKVHI